MLNSLTLRQQHFLYQRKNLYNQEPLRSSSGETAPEDDYKTSWLDFFILIPSHRTLSEDGSVVTYSIQEVIKAGTVQSICRESSFGNIQEVWYSCAGTGNACEAFVMTCRQAVGIKPIVWGEAEFGRLPANKRMHGIENAALFYVPAHDIPSSVIYHYHIFCFRHIPIHVMI